MKNYQIYQSNSYFPENSRSNEERKKRKARKIREDEIECRTV
jgi:hypothetical protein